jgi:hypothetical protein
LSARQDGAGPKLCPSARAEPGASLIGVVGPDGTVGMLRDPLEIDAAFLEQISADGLRPEQRFRFTAPCVEDRCSQWNGCKCTIPDQVRGWVEPDEARSLVPCGIRSACRWFGQDGPEACRLCPMVITDTREAVAAA